MGLWDELEAIAKATFLTASDNIEDTTIGLSSSETIPKIEEFRTNLNRGFTISDSYWNMLQSSTYLIKLDGPLSSIEAVARARARAGNFGPLSAHSIINATDAAAQHNGSSFCQVNSKATVAIKGFLSESQFNLGQHSYGVYSTLPQHILQGSNCVPRPAQVEYPVCDPSAPRPKLAADFSGLWKMQGLVDDPRGNSIFDGKAFLANDKKHEDALQVYETDAYEVVQCHVEMKEGKPVDGLTFRFKGKGS
ncbi:hypothetical protein B0T10DRAFT_578739 [Thelonectria olida]|uniref:Uncharacterized protein n=1 Tax=Thelonectria olida TaxID=1576542 RepID=A0A9P8WH79_9HYPO|nr:hypothetical protein B0T10DRAFT_578739 [Thelonectria olida]